MRNNALRVGNAVRYTHLIYKNINWLYRHADAQVTMQITYRNHNYVQR